MGDDSTHSSLRSLDGTNVPSCPGCHSSVQCAYAPDIAALCADKIVNLLPTVLSILSEKSGAAYASRISVDFPNDSNARSLRQFSGLSRLMFSALGAAYIGEPLHSQNLFELHELIAQVRFHWPILTSLGLVEVKTLPSL